MSQEENSSQNSDQEINLSEEELNESELKQLIQKTLQEGSPEAKFLLRISEWSRPGSSFSDYGKMQILYGKVEKIVIDKIYNYPSTDQVDYVIIPKSRVVVILHKSGNDYEGELISHAKLYVFSVSKGWVKLELY
ncbi:hypothetical protein [Sulfolobus islandicus rudivirus 1 variant XX]|uniref:Uncharacterized protein n=1 Tax=Sulfolobus islandicus rod-shaped virus 1 TaxID=157898 RepID=Q5TJ74_SIRV1|nr:hypothetical protein [Sulfolobus islandicus rudivirus 1 variant XX]